MDVPRLGKTTLAMPVRKRSPAFNRCISDSLQEFLKEDLAPTPPNEGPPLPRFLTCFFRKLGLEVQRIAKVSPRIPRPRPDREAFKRAAAKDIIRR